MPPSLADPENAFAACPRQGRPEPDRLPDCGRAARLIRLGLCVLGVTVGWVSTAAAATFTVNSTADVVDASPGDGVCETAPSNGVCTLRAAIQETNALAGADTVNVPAGTHTVTIAGIEDAAAAGDFDITDELTVSGSGSATTIVDGGALDRVFDIDTGVVASLAGLTVRNGDSGGVNGGGLRNADNAALTLTDVIVSGNVSGNNGGGIHSRGGSTSLVLANVTVTNNTASQDGGGILFRESTATLSISDVTISGNISSNSGGGLVVRAATGTVTLTDVTVSGNSASRDGGGIQIRESTAAVTLQNLAVSGNSGGAGGGIHLRGSTGAMTLLAMTISGNNGDEGAGIFADTGAPNLTNVTLSGNVSTGSGGGITNDGASFTFTNVTLSGNSAPASQGGGIENQGGTVTLTNTIVANSPTGDNCSGTITDGGFNLADDTTCGTIPSTLTGLDPTLADNGGPTRTHALLAGSSAIDSGTNSGCPSGDQRHFLRSDGACDIGAYEFGAVLPVTLSSFEATSGRGGTRFEWSTATETGNVGFNIYALADGDWLKVNRKLIPSRVIDSAEPQDYLSTPSSGVSGSSSKTWISGDGPSSTVHSSPTRPTVARGTLPIRSTGKPSAASISTSAGRGKGGTERPSRLAPRKAFAPEAAWSPCSPPPRLDPAAVVRRPPTGAAE